MKIFVTIFSFIFFCTTQAQQKSHKDDLQKYTYAVLLTSQYQDVVPIPAAGFFYKYQDNYYFITTFHTFASIYISTKKYYSNKWDKMFVMVYSDSAKKNISIPVDLVNVAGWHISPFYYYEEADIIALNFKNPHLLKINQINEILDDAKAELITPNKVTYFGFDPKPNTPVMLDTLKSTIQTNEIQGDINSYQYYSDIKLTDRFNLFLTKGAKSEYTGSPVIFNYKDKNVLGGMILGINNNNTGGAIILSAPAIYLLIKNINKNPGNLFYTFDKSMSN